MAAPAIPIDNIYFLLSYAWDRLEEAELSSVSLTDESTLPGLLARLLIGGVTRVLKRGIDRQYVTYEEEIAGIRGRLNLARSIKTASFGRARAWCAFDELSLDVIHNRIIKTTLRQLAEMPALQKGTVRDLRRLYQRMPGVAEIAINEGVFRRIHLSRSTSFYRFLLDVCELVHQNLLTHESTGEVTFRDFTRDDKQMASLFERFLINFYRREQRVYRVSSEHLQWRAEGTPRDLGLLPQMRTDIVLRKGQTTIVVDAKYYAEMLKAGWGRGTLRSQHLYQLFAYMSHLVAGEERGSVRGILIYPRTVASEHISARIYGHPVLAATVDLSQPPASIRRQLLRLVEIAQQPVYGQTTGRAQLENV